MALYQPGGVEEKKSLNEKLTKAKTASNTQDALDTLRTWERYRERAKVLGVYLPDPAVQHEFLDTVVS